MKIRTNEDLESAILDGIAHTKVRKARGPHVDVHANRRKDNRRQRRQAKHEARLVAWEGA